MDTHDDRIVKIQLPRFALIGAAGGVGVSTILLGILFEFKQRGLTIAAASLSSSLIEPTHYRRITGHLSHTLDPWMLTPEQRLNSFARLTTGAELIIVEGDHGLFDKRDNDARGDSNADIVRDLKLPVILVVDAEGTCESIAPLALGFSAYDQRVKVLGVIANRVKDKTHNDRIRAAVESLNGPKYLGGLPYKETPLDTTTCLNPSLITRSRLVTIKDQVVANIDISGLVKIARMAEPLDVSASILSAEKISCRIAVADDAAFHLLVQDNLDLLRRAGAELKAFSPLADVAVPSKCQGVYLPSGYVGLYHKELSANFEMMKSLRAFVAQGGVLFAEGDAAAYLCREFSILGQEPVTGVNILPGTATALTEKLEPDRFNLCHVKTVEQNMLLPRNGVLHGIRDARWSIRLEEQVQQSFYVYDHSDVNVGTENDESLPLLGGMMPKPNILVSLVQTHWGSNPDIAKRFVDFVKSQARHAEA